MRWCITRCLPSESSRTSTLRWVLGNIFPTIGVTGQRTRNEVIWVSERDVLSVCENPSEIHLRERAQGRSSRYAPPTSYTNGPPVVRMVFQPAQQSRAFDSLQEVPKKGPKSMQRRTEIFCVASWFFIIFFCWIVLEPTELPLGNPEGHKRSGARTYRSIKLCWKYNL
jgi:hypothetical protein